MKETIVQADFGGFNPRFMGISLKITSREAFKILQDYLTGEASSIGSDASLLEIATNSVLDHECRHYHDFLISPYSSHLLRLRFQALVNGAQALNCLPLMVGNCLAVPLSRWLVMGEDERTTQLEDWEACARQPDMPAWNPVPLPVKSQEEMSTDLAPVIADVSQLPDERQFLMYLDGAVRGYLRIEQITRGFTEHSYVRPCNIYEATALTTQIFSIRQNQGLIPALQFLQYLLDSEAGYAQLWRNFLQMALLLEQQRQPGVAKIEITLDALLPLMWMGEWCLLGNYQVEGTQACPTVRFMKLVNHLVDDHRDPRNWDRNLGDIWDYWDQQMEVLSWRQSLEKLLEFNQRGLDNYHLLAGQWQADMTVPQLLTSVMQTYVTEQSVMVGHLLNDPEYIVNPHRYLNAKLGQFPLPFVKIELEGFAMPKSKDHIFRSLWDIEIEEKTYTTRFTFAWPDLKDDVKLLDDVIAIEELMNWCDLAFSSHTMPWEVYETTRRNLEELTQKRVLLIV